MKGVQVQQFEGGPIHNLTVKSEVILAAGSINTPLILMLSGIGDPAMLAPLNIPVVKNITSVGKGLQVRLLIRSPRTTLERGLMSFA